jgi:arabinose-5-phosphate isomerase
MHPVDELPLVTEHTLMSDALVTMSNKSFGCAGVLNSDGCLIGIITDGDLRRHMSPQLLMQKASEIMTPNPATVTPDILMAQAFAHLNQRAKKPITTLFVVESTDYPAKPCGLLHIHDFLRMGMA